jgi:dihydropteroate synthase
MPLGQGRSLDLGARALVMGILNVTPDSFAEATPKLDPDAAVEAGVRMEADGADIIDVGGESTRPGAETVSADDESARVLPVIDRLARRVNIPISIDTSKAAVARRALEAGASIVNDVSGLRFGHELAQVAAACGAPLVLMHSRGRAKTMDQEAVYGDVVVDLIRELRDSIAIATAAGLPRDRIIVDPGVGFAKRPAHSYGVLARLTEVAAALGRPVLVGPSRKSFMRAALDDRAATQRDWGTAAAVTACVLAGAHVIRVHAVAEMAQVVRVAEEIRGHD